MPKFIDWVPTQPECVDTFFDLAPLSSSDIVYDLGSGDGRLLFAALEKGAGKCVGIDIDFERVSYAKQIAREKGVDEKVTFIDSDVLRADLSAASVIFCYLYPTAYAALRSKLEEELKPGTRIVMESFPVPGWKAAKVEHVLGRNFYLYTMPIEKTEDYDIAIKNLNVEPYYEYPGYDDAIKYSI